MAVHGDGGFLLLTGRIRTCTAAITVAAACDPSTRGGGRTRGSGLSSAVCKWKPPGLRESGSVALGSPDSGGVSSLGSAAAGTELEKPQCGVCVEVLSLRCAQERRNVLSLLSVPCRVCCALNPPSGATLQIVYSWFYTRTR